MMLLLIGLEFCLCHAMNDYVARHNVGTAFRLHHQPLLMNIGHADLTIAIPYNIEPPLLRDMTVSDELRTMILNTTLPHVQHMVDITCLLDNMTMSLYDECEAVYTDVATFLANPKQATQAKQTREYIQYMAAIPTGIIGLARQQAVDMLYQHMLEVDRVVNSRDGERAAADRVIRLLSSQQLNVKKTLDLESVRISKLVSYVNNTFNAMALQIGKVTTGHIRELHVENGIVSVFIAITADLLSMGHYLDRYTLFLEALHTLQEGGLPRRLVSQAEASSAYRNLTTFLEQHFNGTDQEGTTLTPLTEQELYEKGLVTFMFTEDHLYAHLRVPTFHPRDRFKLFSVYRLPLPFHTNNVSALGYTILNENSDRFAVSELLGTHISFDHGMIAQCTNTKGYLLCDFPMAVRPATYDTCFSAIFTGTNIPLIQKLCNFKGFPTRNTPSTAVSLGDNKFAIATSFDSYTVKCKVNTKEQRTPCGFCIVSLPPACTLSLRDLEISSTPLGQNRSFVIETHAVNLPLALAFDLPIKDIKANFEHNAPIKIDVPRLSMDEVHKLPFTRESLQQGVDIIALATAVQQYDKMNAAHKASLQFVNTVSNPVTNTVVLIINVLLAIVVVFVVTKVYRMSRTLAVCLQALKLMRSAESRSISFAPGPMILSKADPTLTPQAAILKSVNYETHLLAAIVTILCLWTLVKLIRFLGINLWLKPARAAAKTANPALKLKIYTRSTNYVFHLISFKAEASSIQFLEVPSLMKMTYNGGPTANLTWSGPLSCIIAGKSCSKKLNAVINIPQTFQSVLAPDMGNVQTDMNGLVSTLMFKSASAPGLPLLPGRMNAHLGYVPDTPCPSAPECNAPDSKSSDGPPSGADNSPQDEDMSAIIMDGPADSPNFFALRQIVHDVWHSDCQAECA